nr:MAG: coat protein [Leviviridae sp.]
MTTNITVPNGAVTPVNKTFTVSRPASGDDSAVLHLREGANEQAYVKLEFSTKSTQVGNMRGRQAVVTSVTPFGYTDVNGVFVQQGMISTSVKTTIPVNAPDAVRKDHAAYVAGILGNQQVRDLVILGYAT